VTPTGEEAAAAERLHVRGLEGLPMNPERARFELSEGERALRGTRPPNGRRWRQLAKIDEQLDRLTQRHEEAVARLHEAERQLTSAPRDDATSLAAWIAKGERGARPAPTVYERQRERDAAKMIAEGFVVEIDRLLEQRLQHVEKHREKMIADARSDLAEKRARILEVARQLPALRAELLEAREQLQWVASYPAPVEGYGFTSSVALGLRQPTERTLGTRGRVEYQGLVGALEADADALAERFHPDVKKRLGTAPDANPTTEAMWDSEVPAEWKRQQLEHARRVAEYALDPHAVADEARDYRPDPA
jgi:hypothetical protein